MSAKESLNLINMAQIAKNSSTRAYTGHSSEVRFIFDINNLNNMASELLEFEDDDEGPTPPSMQGGMTPVGETII